MIQANDDSFFWETARLGKTKTLAVSQNGITYSYEQLDEVIEATCADIKSCVKPRALIFIKMSNHVDCVIKYLACLRAKHPVLLLPNDLQANLLNKLIKTYNPAFTLVAGTPVSKAIISSQGYTTVKDENLGLLLSTSGSTGSPKLVKLSYGAVQANAQSIANYLHIQPDERTLTTLPLYYSYGLSVLNSYLYAGGSIFIDNTSPLTQGFYETLEKNSINSIAGVPYYYQMLYRSGFFKQELSSLKTLTQAGGRLDTKLKSAFSDFASKNDIRFFVMYGQTEATARISYVPPERLEKKINSIGIPIPDGRLEIDPENRELIYYGPNVMLGYAETKNDLNSGDNLKGILRTGDTAEVDEEGFFYITGRLKRFIKIAGNRIGLDEVEHAIEARTGCPVATTGHDDKMMISIELTNKSQFDEIAKDLKSWIFETYKIHHSMLKIQALEKLPLNANGKKDYAHELLTLAKTKSS